MRRTTCASVRICGPPCPSDIGHQQKTLLCSGVFCFCKFYIYVVEVVVVVVVTGVVVVVEGVVVTVEVFKALIAALRVS